MANVVRSTRCQLPGPIFRTTRLCPPRNRHLHIQRSSHLRERPPPRETPRVLQAIPTGTILRSLLILSVTVLPQQILSGLIRTIRHNAQAIESVRALRWMTMKTFYENFCIGSTKDEIASNIAALRKMGISGVILAYARESQQSSSGPQSRLTLEDGQFTDWIRGNFETVQRLGHGDYLAIRCTGAGAAATALLEKFSTVCRERSLQEAESLHGDELDLYTAQLQDTCAATKTRGVRVLIDSETARHQAAIERVALRLMSTHNRNGRAVVLHTYQMYLKSRIETIQKHLQHSIKNNYTLGLKLVHGAYLHVEPDRSIIHNSKSETDASFDQAVAQLLQTPSNPWSAEVMLASHNSKSVKEALVAFVEHRKSKARFSTSTDGGVKSLTFAQLMGMADELSLELSDQIRKLQQDDPAIYGQENDSNSGQGFPVLGVYKYTVWGSLQECLLYLLRRAEENRDSLARSRESAAALLSEIRHRLFRH